MSNNAYLELLKQENQQESHKKKSAEENSRAAATIAYKDYKGYAGNIAEGLDQHLAASRADRKGRRKNTWEYATDGVTQGLSTGLKMVSEKEKVNNVMSYLTQVGDAAAQQNAWYEKEADFNKDMRDPARTSIDLMYSGRPYEEILADLKKIEEVAQANNPNFKGRLVSFTPNSTYTQWNVDGEQKIIDLRTFAGESHATAARKGWLERQSLAEGKNQAEREDRSIAARERNATNYEHSQNPQVIALQVRARKNAEYVHEIQPKLEIADKSVADLEKIVTIASNASAQGSGVIKEIQRYLQETTGHTYSQDSIQMLLQSSYGNAGSVLGPGARSDKDMELFGKTLLTMDKDPKAFLQMAKIRIAEGKSQAGRYREQLAAYNKDPTANLYESTSNLSDQSSVKTEKEAYNKSSHVNSSPDGQQMVNVRINGKVGKIAENQVDAAAVKYGEAFELIQ